MACGPWWHQAKQVLRNCPRGVGGCYCQCQLKQAVRQVFSCQSYRTRGEELSAMVVVSFDVAKAATRF